MERHSHPPRRPKKGQYELIIDRHGDDLSDAEIAIFYVLHEGGSIEEAAAEAEFSVDMAQGVVDRYMPKKEERRNKRGELYMRRLTQEAIRSILATHDDLDERERSVFQSLIGAQNQVVAASSLGMKHTAFSKELIAIRKKHGL